MIKDYLEALERLYKCNDDDYTLGYQQHDYKLLQEALLKMQKNEKVLKVILQNIELDEDYSEQISGSTKAYKLVIPNDISVEEYENYTDDCFPNSDFEVIDDFVKEKSE